MGALDGNAEIDDNAGGMADRHQRGEGDENETQPQQQEGARLTGENFTEN